MQMKICVFSLFLITISCKRQGKNCQKSQLSGDTKQKCNVIDAKTFIINCTRRNYCTKQDEEFEKAKHKHSADDYYFDSYSHFGIHEEMLKDEVRTQTYRDAIYMNRHLFEGKVVLDVGCGTGILSLFAAKAGAKRVIGVDYSAIADIAKQIVRTNNFSHVITIIRGKIEEIELPPDIDKVDIIVSEWMGYCLFFESMLETVLFARDKWLKPNGLIFPDYAALYILGIEDHIYKRDKIHWWENVYGFNMSIMGRLARAEPLVDFVDSKQVVTNSILLKEINIYTATKDDLQFATSFKLIVQFNDYIHALAAYFVVKLNKLVKHEINTSPFHKITRWRQCTFYLNNMLIVKYREVIEGSFQLKLYKSEDIYGDTKISITFNGELSKVNETNVYKITPLANFFHSY